MLPSVNQDYPLSVSDMFTNPFPNAFGLDMSDRSIKVVQLRRLRGRLPAYALVSAGAVRLPEGIIERGEIIEPEKTRTHIRELLAGEKKARKPIASKWVVASLPESQTFFKRLTIPKRGDQLLEDDVWEHAARHMPFDRDAYYLSWQAIPPIENEAETTDVVVGAAPKRVANSYTYLLESLGLGVIALESEALSLSRALIPEGAEEEDAMGILDIGATRANLIVSDYGMTQASIALPFSGDDVTATLSQKMGMSLDEAEQKKIDSGLDFKKTKGKAFHILATHIDQCAQHIKKAITFYDTHFENRHKISVLALTGGSAHLKNLDRVLALKLKMKVRLGNPWTNVSLKKSSRVPLDAPLLYATAVGLALRAVENPFAK